VQILTTAANNENNDDDHQEPYASMMTSTYEAYVRLLPAFENVLNKAREEQQAAADLQQQQNKEKAYVAIVTCDNHKFSMPSDCHFLQSSGFLTRLHLQAGDVLKLTITASFMEKALEFYSMDEKQPFPELPRSLPMNHEEIVGESYWGLISALTPKELAKFIADTNLLGFSKLLDFGCFALAKAIRAIVQQICQSAS